MKKTLDKRLKKQVHLAAWSFILLTIYIVFLTLNMINKSSQPILNRSAKEIVYAFGAIIPMIAFIPIWIVGIVNAVKISRMSKGGNALLVVMAVFVFMFGHLIVAIVANKKAIENPNYEDRFEAPSQMSKERALKAAFTNGIITAAEYEKKKKQL